MLSFRNWQRGGVSSSRMDRMVQDLSRTGAVERDVEQVLFISSVLLLRFYVVICLI